MEGHLRAAFVIGMGEVGRRLTAALERAGLHVRPVTRDRGWPAALSHSDALRLVCVREEALAEVVDRLRSVDPARLAFVQNGWVGEVLGPVRGCTRGLIWFTSKGEFFRELRSSPFNGPAAAALAGALTRGGLHAGAVSDEVFTRLDVEKMGFNCVVGLPLAVHGVPLGAYLETYAEEAHAVFTEATTVCATALGVAADPTWWDAFVQLSRPLAWVTASTAKALDYRNGAVVRLARETGLGAPVNTRLLQSLGSAR